MRAVDLVGRRFGRLTIIAIDGHIGRERAWLCRCDCGMSSRVTGGSLTTGNTSSCGCLRLERVTRHGLSASPEYFIWKAARNRCHNRRAQGYQNYGARGITMCEAWRTSFSAFYSDIGARPSPAHSLDRINNDGPYAPDNCRWATQREQHRNTRASRRLSAFGQTAIITAWSEMRGIRAGAIRDRLNRGWSVEDALTLRPERGRKHMNARHA